MSLLSAITLPITMKRRANDIKIKMVAYGRMLMIIGDELANSNFKLQYAELPK